MHAQIELGNDLSAVGAAHVWQAHGSKQYGISTFALAKRCLGQRGAAVEVVLRPGGQPFKGQRATHARLDSFEHGLCDMHDFGAYAVARQYGNAVVIFHRIWMWGVNESTSEPDLHLLQPMSFSRR